MAHNTLISGTSYEISGGNTTIDGTVEEIATGRSLIGSSGYNITFGPEPYTLYSGGSWNSQYYQEKGSSGSYDNLISNDSTQVANGYLTYYPITYKYFVSGNAFYWYNKRYLTITSSTYNLTPYSQLNLNYSVTSGTYALIYLGYITNSNTKAWASLGYKRQDSTGYGTFTVDISGLSGYKQLVVVASCQTAMACNPTIKITKAWLS